MNRERRNRWLVLIAAALVGLVAFAILTERERRRTDFRAQAGFLPGNPRRGGELFFDRGCAGCHSIAGVGGGDASDLARSVGTPHDVAEIAGEMWNHAPEMWEKMASRGYATPELTPRDFVDLMAFLFAAGHLEEEGDPERGEAVLVNKKCRNCHATGEKEQKVGPDLIRWSSKVNPILWAQLFWNHAPAMEEAMREQGLPWPELTPNEVVDLVAFVRSVGTGARDIAPLPGDPWMGRQLFRQHCRRCHRAEGDGGDIGPELGVGSGPPTLTGLAASLWNHAPAMGERMSELGIERPVFSVQEMTDLITYLFAIRYFETPGDAAVGREVFARSCSECHGAADEGDRGPSLHAGGASATFIASALWNHGPSMYEEMKSRGLEWPQLGDREMHDLLEYLRTLQ